MELMAIQKSNNIYQIENPLSQSAIMLGRESTESVYQSVNENVKTIYVVDMYIGKVLTG